MSIKFYYAQGGIRYIFGLCQMPPARRAGGEKDSLLLDIDCRREMFMKKTKNVFLTTLGETKNRLDINYFFQESGEHTLFFTTGVSVAEAGMKYILSRYPIDEIIMIGAPAVVREDVTRSTSLSDVTIHGISDLGGMSEYDFLNYRIAQYMLQTDIELIDLGEPIDPERKNELKGRINDFQRKKARDVPFKQLFTKLSKDQDLAEAFFGEVMKDTDASEKSWIKYYIYNGMDSYYKMHILDENKDALLRFVPVSTGDILSMEDMNRIVRMTTDNAGGEVSLYMDVQGLGTMDGNTLISTHLIMNQRIGYGCHVRGLIHSYMVPGSFSGKVTNVLRGYEIQKLISGLEMFLAFGKVDTLKEYWQTLNISEPDADRLFYGMDCIDEGICLCNVDLIAYGINVIRKTLHEPVSTPDNRNIYLDVIMRAITSDYGSLLDGEELSVAELLKWCLRKGLYQQLLTLIESKVPGDMVKRGIYYYARNEEDIKALMNAFNLLYWNESSKMRWAFGDIEHYFIKSYGRSFLDFRQKPDMVAKDFARLKIDALRGGTEDILPAYSQLDNDDLLYELLLGYYRIGNLRNQVNHAVVDETDLDAAVLSPRKDSRRELDMELKKFIGIYSTVCRKTVKTQEPVLLSPMRMKSYSRRHQIMPLEQETDDIARGHYICSFNGKEVDIRISLFQPEEDVDVD